MAQGPGTPDEGVRRRVLDAASPPLSAAAREAYLGALDEGWADPRRLHAEGRRARALLDGAREAVASVVGVLPAEVAFTPNPTVALHTGLRGLLHGRRRAGAGLVLSAVEHSALLHTGQWHEAAGGGTTLVEVDRLGRVDVEAFVAAAGSPGVAAAALQAANGEVGTRQPVDDVPGRVGVAHRVRAAGVPLLVDATSTLGRDAVPAGWDVLVGAARAWG
ncbi:aminotransferase class V-fold PLP-dependent enzyme, partial [Angustibacter aerolatus]